MAPGVGCLSLIAGGAGSIVGQGGSSVPARRAQSRSACRSIGSESCVRNAGRAGPRGGERAESFVAEMEKPADRWAAGAIRRFTISVILEHIVNDVKQKMGGGSSAPARTGFGPSLRRPSPPAAAPSPTRHHAARARFRKRMNLQREAVGQAMAIKPGQGSGDPVDAPQYAGLRLALRRTSPGATRTFTISVIV